MPAEYQSSPGYFRAFCSNCGSPIYGRSVSSPGIRRVRLGTLDTDPGGRVVANVWASIKAPWFEIAEGVAQFPQMPPQSHLLPP